MSDKGVWAENLAKIEQFYDKAWFTDPNRSGFWLRMYSCVCLSFDQFSRSPFPLLSIDYPRPCRFYYGTVEGWKTTRSFHQVLANENGDTMVSSRGLRMPIHKANYVLITTPHKIDGNVVDENQLRDDLNIIEGLVACSMGKNLLFQIAFDGPVDSGTGDMGEFSDIIWLPKNENAPFLADENWRYISNIVERLTVTELERRQRIELALTYVSAALATKDSFPNYWIAIELANGGSGIEASLSAAYGLSSQHEARDMFGCTAIREWRNAYFHNGIKRTLSPSIERYFQCLFLDIAHFVLNLDTPRLAERMIRSGEFDLGPVFGR